MRLRQSNPRATVHQLYLKASGPSFSKRRQLNELVKGHFVNCFSRFNVQYSDIFC